MPVKEEKVGSKHSIRINAKRAPSWINFISCSSVKLQYYTIHSSLTITDSQVTDEADDDAKGVYANSKDIFGEDDVEVGEVVMPATI